MSACCSRARRSASASSSEVKHLRATALAQLVDFLESAVKYLRARTTSQALYQSIRDPRTEASNTEEAKVGRPRIRLLRFALFLADRHFRTC